MITTVPPTAQVPRDLVLLIDAALPLSVLTTAVVSEYEHLCTCCIPPQLLCPLTGELVPFIGFVKKIIVTSDNFSSHHFGVIEDLHLPQAAGIVGADLFQFFNKNISSGDLVTFYHLE